MGTIPTARLQWLYPTYKSSHDTHPEEHNRLDATYFASDLAALLLRYKTLENSKHTQPHNPSTHPAFAKAISLQRSASPLDHSPLIPTYCSQFEQDQIFGAQWDAYTRPWDGTCVAHPMHDDKGMEKAVRWALPVQNIQSSLTMPYPHAPSSC